MDKKNGTAKDEFYLLNSAMGPLTKMQTVMSLTPCNNYLALCYFTGCLFIFGIKFIDTSKNIIGNVDNAINP